MTFLLLLMSWTTPSPATQDKAFSGIDAFMQSLIDTAKIHGITIAITKDKEIVYSKAFGVANSQTKDNLRPEHIFHVASISKTFTATAVMQLAEKGKIDINKPLVHYLPYFKMDDERYKTITIKQMLNHTSGIPDVEDYEWEKAVADEGAAERYNRSLSDQKLVSAPGEEFNYSNMAFDIMADLVAKVSGMSFEKYVKENILMPLQMRESSFYAPEIKKSLRTTPHTGMPPVVSTVYPYNRMHAPSSTLNTNVLELSSWAIANMYDGEYKGKRIFSPKTYALMTTPTFTIDEERQLSIGLSWFIYKHDGILTREHSGGDLGYRSMLTIMPEKKLGIIILSSQDQLDMDQIRNKVRDIVLAKY
jgi:CubicO group peptidase (beta-lactamase class C family)